MLIANWLRSAFDDGLVEYPRFHRELRRTPSTELNLQPGELVQIKSRAESLATLDMNNKTRGRFDVEMVPYCGGTYRVLRRVERIADERTGRMLRLPNVCIVLGNVLWGACLRGNRMFRPGVAARTGAKSGADAWMISQPETSQPNMFHALACVT
jgi:hypothetical protein